MAVEMKGLPKSKIKTNFKEIEAITKAQDQDALRLGYNVSATFIF